MKRLIGTVLLASTLLVQGQERYFSFGFVLPEKKKSVEIPFEEYNNLIVIPVVINDLIQLKFIVDTGVQTTILTDKIFGSVLNLSYSRQVTVKAPGIQDSISAAVANGVSFRLPGNVKGTNLNMLVLEDDYLKLSEKMGDAVYGVIGYDLFRNFVVKINYDNKILTLVKPEKFKPKKRYKMVPLEVEDAKPYLRSIASQSSNQDSLRLLIDTGASHAVLLDLNQTTFARPEQFITTQLGTGLGGEIHGEVARLNSWQVNSMRLQNLIMSIPDPDEYSLLLKRGARHGTLGGELLSRFNPVLDYPNQKLYLTKSRRFSKKFEYDMSGLDLSTRGENFDSLHVDYVRANSPAIKAGIRPGDHILSINGYTMENSRFGDILSLLRKRPRMKIKAFVYRDGEILKKKFRLERSI